MILNVSVGDMVFVMDMGPATVTRVNVDGGFEVKVPGRGSFFFQKEGTSGSSTRQRVFYHDPVFIQPPSDLTLWTAFKRVATQLYEEMAALR